MPFEGRPRLPSTLPFWYRSSRLAAPRLRVGRVLGDHLVHQAQGHLVLSLGVLLESPSIWTWMG